LARGAQVLAARLTKEVDGGLAAIGRIVCSVPPQHMFGLECSVMLPLICGIRCSTAGRSCPPNVRAAFAGGCRGRGSRRRWHLRGLVESFETVPSQRRRRFDDAAVCARRRQSEDLVGAPVLEIYGSTETGAVADAPHRALRAAGGRLDGVRARAGRRCHARPRHALASPATLLDELKLEPTEAFTLLGRHNDLIKIAGRRTSLAGLNCCCSRCQVSRTACSTCPPPATRPSGSADASIGPPQDARAQRRGCGGHLDPVFMPRAFIRSSGCAWRHGKLAPAGARPACVAAMSNRRP
jgi:hypothetical protein